MSEAGNSGHVLTLGRGMRKMRAEMLMLTDLSENEREEEAEREGRCPKIGRVSCRRKKGEKEST